MRGRQLTARSVWSTRSLSRPGPTFSCGSRRKNCQRAACIAQRVTYAIAMRLHLTWLICGLALMEACSADGPQRAAGVVKSDTEERWVRNFAVTTAFVPADADPNGLLTREMVKRTVATHAGSQRGGIGMPGIYTLDFADTLLLTDDLGRVFVAVVLGAREGVRTDGVTNVAQQRHVAEDWLDTVLTHAELTRDELEPFRPLPGERVQSFSATTYEPGRPAPYTYFLSAGGVNRRMDRSPIENDRRFEAQPTRIAQGVRRSIDLGTVAGLRLGGQVESALVPWVAQLALDAGWQRWFTAPDTPLVVDEE